MIASTPDPPYYAVIFTSIGTDDMQGYERMARHMEELACQQPGFLGVESVRDDMGITVSYWKDEASIRAWKRHVEHQVAQRKGRTDWYARYHVRVARVERDQAGGREVGSPSRSGSHATAR